jgi:hypothetical protein
MRRAAYARAKAQRATDPEHLALKEAMKERRRKAYKQAKERRKAFVGKQKARQEKRRAEKRVSLEVELLKRVKPAADPE